MIIIANYLIFIHYLNIYSFGLPSVLALESVVYGKGKKETINFSLVPCKNGKLHCNVLEMRRDFCVWSTTLITRDKRRGSKWRRNWVPTVKGFAAIHFHLVFIFKVTKSLCDF